MWFPVKTRTIAQNVSVERETLYLSDYKLDALHMFELGDPTPILDMGWGYGTKYGAIRKFRIGFLLALLSNQSAISSRLRTTRHRLRRTDRRTELG